MSFIYKVFTIILIIIFMLVFNVNVYENAKANTFVLTATGLSFASGLGEVLVSAALIGVAGYMSYKVVSGIIAKRMNMAYNSLTTSERYAFDNKVSAWDGTSSITLDKQDLIDIGAAKFIGALNSEYTSYVTQSFANNIISVPSVRIGIEDTIPVNIEVPQSFIDSTNSAKDSLKNIINRLGLDIFIYYNTYGAVFGPSDNKIYLSDVYDFNGKLMGYVVSITYCIASQVSGNSFTKKFGIVYVPGISNYWTDYDYDIPDVLLTNNDIENLIKNGTRLSSMYFSYSLSGYASYLAGLINNSIMSGLLTGQDVYPTFPLVGNGSIEVSSPVVQKGSISIPQEIVVAGDPSVNFDDPDIIPLIPPIVLNNNPDISDALSQGTVTESLTNTIPVTGTQQQTESNIDYSTGDKVINWQPLLTAFDTVNEKFPFSIPWDIKRIIDVFNVPEKKPVLSYTLTIFGSQYNIDLDLTSFDDIISKLRVLELIMFDISLILFARRLANPGEG